MADIEELFEYDDDILASDEVLDYQERLGIFFQTDWMDRSWARFREFHETGSSLSRVRGLGALAVSITQRNAMHEIHMLDAHFALELVPDHIDF